MKIVLKSLLMLSLCFISLTGCSTVKDDVEETADRFSGNVEIMWDDVKDELNQIEQDITGNSDNDLLEQEDVSVLVTTIKDGYDKIRDGITQDNQEEAKKVYEAAVKLEDMKNNTAAKLDDDEEKILELGEKMKTLMKHYYGQGEGSYNEALADVKERLDQLNDFSDEKWTELNNKLK